MRLAIRLAPKAAAERILGLIDEPPDGVALKIAVTAPAEAGKANTALLRLLAKRLRLPQRDFSLLSGRRERRKLVQITGNPVVLAQLLEESLRPWLRRD